MDDLELSPGDVVEIIHPKTKKRTAAFVDSEIFQAEQYNSIHMDFFIRRNLGAQFNDTVKIQKIMWKPAVEVVFSGYQLPHKINLENANLLAKKLHRKLLTIGDILSFSYKKKRLDLIVKEHVPPAPAVQIVETTNILYKD